MGKLYINMIWYLKNKSKLDTLATVVQLELSL